MKMQLLIILAFFSVLGVSAKTTVPTIRTDNTINKNLSVAPAKYKIKINHTFNYANGCSITISGTVTVSCCFSGSFSGSVTIAGNCSGSYNVSYSSKAESDFSGSDQAGVINNDWKAPSTADQLNDDYAAQLAARTTLANNGAFQSDFVAYLSLVISTH